MTMLRLPNADDAATCAVFVTDVADNTYSLVTDITYAICQCTKPSPPLSTTVVAPSSSLSFQKELTIGIRNQPLYSRRLSSTDDEDTSGSSSIDDSHNRNNISTDNSSMSSLDKSTPPPLRKQHKVKKQMLPKRSSKRRFISSGGRDIVRDNF